MSSVIAYNEEFKIKVVWREYFNEAAVKSLTEMGTLPRNESMIDVRFEDGEGVASLIAQDCWDNDPESFREGGEIVILEPAEFAGTYDITTEYTPHFYAHTRDE